VFAANGIVTAEAKASFEKAVALDASDVPARYFLGLAAEKDGNRAQAAALWRALIAAAPPDAPWIDFIRGALARVDDGAASGDPSRGASGGQSGSASGGPTEDQVAASSKLDPEQRKAMIQGMVERLSERLHRDGSDAEGWLRLVRSYMVLGEREKALAAVLDARRALAGDPTNLRRLDDLVKGLGLEG
jgi:cytochrome c-type biogenesis protein CcmH